MRSRSMPDAHIATPLTAWQLATLLSDACDRHVSPPSSVHSMKCC